MNLVILILHDYTKITTEREHVMSHTQTKGYDDHQKRLRTNSLGCSDTLDLILNHSNFIKIEP